MNIVTASQMQEMDRRTIQEFGIPGRVLMENAGRGATRIFLKHLYSRGPGRVGVLAGKGNNGGDGFVVARYLAQRGIHRVQDLLDWYPRAYEDRTAAVNISSLVPHQVVSLKANILKIY